MKRSINQLKNIVIKDLIALSQALNFPKKNPVGKSPPRFLIVSTTGIGDTLWGTPAIRALRKTFPQCYIGVLTNNMGFKLLEGNFDIDDFFIFQRGLKGHLALPGLLAKLREKYFDTAFIFHASDRIIWPLCYFTGANEIIGISGQNKDLDFVLTQAIRSQHLKHGIETRLEIVKLVGVNNIQGTILMHLSDKNRDHVRSFLRDNLIGEDSLLIGLHPGAQKPFKCWPAENFIAVGNILIKKFGGNVIVTGNADEKALALKIASKIAGAISVAGKFSLRETAALIEKMNIFITNDTGPMHIAFAFKTPTIALFSPTNPEYCGPYNVDSAIVISKPRLCSPCIGKKCEKPLCMEQITPEEVIAHAESLLTKVNIVLFRQQTKGK